MKTFTIQLEENELQIIAIALQERPYREVAKVIATISSQVEQQMQKESNQPKNGNL